MTVDLNVEDDFSFLNLRNYFLNCTRSANLDDISSKSYLDHSKLEKVLQLEVFQDSLHKSGTSTTNEPFITLKNLDGDEVKVSRPFLLALMDLLGVSEAFALELWKQTLSQSVREIMELELEIQPGLIQIKSPIQVLTACTLYFFFARQCVLDSLACIVDLKSVKNEKDTVLKLISVYSNNSELLKRNIDYNYAGIKPLASTEGESIKKMRENYVLAENDMLIKQIHRIILNIDYTDSSLEIDTICIHLLDLFAKVALNGSKKSTFLLLEGFIFLFDCDSIHSSAKQSLFSQLFTSTRVQEIEDKIGAVGHEGIVGALYFAFANVKNILESDFIEIDRTYSRAFQKRGLAFLRLLISAGESKSVDNIHNFIGRYMIHYQKTFKDKTGSFSPLQENEESNRDRLFDLVVLCSAVTTVKPEVASLYVDESQGDDIVVFKDFLETMMLEANPTNIPTSLFVGLLQLIGSLVGPNVGDSVKIKLQEFFFDDKNKSAFSWKFFSKIMAHHIAKINNDFGAVTQGQSQYGSIASQDQVVVASFLKIFNGICSCEDMIVVKNIVIKEISEVNATFVQLLEMLLFKQNQNLLLKPTINTQIFSSISYVVKVLLISGSHVNKQDASRLVFDTCFPLILKWFNENSLDEFVMVEFVNMLDICLVSDEDKRLNLPSQLVEFLIFKVLNAVDLVLDKFGLGLKLLQLLTKSLSFYAATSKEFESDFGSLSLQNSILSTSGNFCLLGSFLSNEECFRALYRALFSLLNIQNIQHTESLKVKDSWFAATKDATNLVYQNNTSAFATEAAEKIGYGYLKLKEGHPTDRLANIIFNKVALFVENPTVKGSPHSRAFLSRNIADLSHNEQLSLASLGLLLEIARKQHSFMSKIEEIADRQTVPVVSTLFSKLSYLESIISTASMNQVLPNHNDGFFNGLFTLLSFSDNDMILNDVLSFLHFLIENKKSVIVLRNLKMVEVGSLEIEDQRAPGFLSFSFINFLRKLIELRDPAKLVDKLRENLVSDKSSILFRKILTRNSGTPKVLKQFLDEQLNIKLQLKENHVVNHNLLGFIYNLLATIFVTSDVAASPETSFWLHQYEAVFVYFKENANEYAAEILGSTLKGLAIEVGANNELSQGRYVSKLFGLNDDGANDITIQFMVKQILNGSKPFNGFAYFLHCLLFFSEKFLLPNGQSKRAISLDAKLMEPRKAIIEALLTFLNNEEANLTPFETRAVTNCIVLLLPQLLRVKTLEAYRIPEIISLVCRSQKYFTTKALEEPSSNTEFTLQNLLCCMVHLLNRLNKDALKPDIIESSLNQFFAEDFCHSEVIRVLSSSYVSPPTIIYCLCSLEASFSLGLKSESFSFSLFMKCLKDYDTLKLLVTRTYEQVLVKQHEDEVQKVFSKLVVTLLRAIGREKEGAIYIATSDILLPLHGSHLSLNTNMIEVEKFVFDMLAVSNAVLERLKPNSGSLFGFSSDSSSFQTQTEKFAYDVLKLIFSQRTLLFQSSRMQTNSFDKDTTLNCSLLFLTICNCFEVCSLKGRVVLQLYPTLDKELDDIAWKIVLNNIEYILGQNYTSLQGFIITSLENALWYLIRKVPSQGKVVNVDSFKKLFDRISKLTLNLFGFYSKTHDDVKVSLQSILEGLLALVAIFVTRLESIERVRKSENLPISTRSLFKKLQQESPDKGLEISIKLLNGVLKDWVEEA